MEARWDPNQPVENLTGILQQRVADVLSRGDTDKKKVNEKVMAVMEGTVQALSNIESDTDKKIFLNKKIDALRNTGSSNLKLQLSSEAERIINEVRTKLQNQES